MSKVSGRIKIQLYQLLHVTELYIVQWLTISQFGVSLARVQNLKYFVAFALEIALERMSRRWNTEVFKEPRAFIKILEIVSFVLLSFYFN